MFFLYLLIILAFICYGQGMSLKNLEHDLSNIHNGSEFYVTLLSGNQFLNKHLSLGGKT